MMTPRDAATFYMQRLRQNRNPSSDSFFVRKWLQNIVISIDSIWTAMPSILRRFYRSTKRRIKQGLRDDRTYKLYRAGCHLLASKDHEQVSVASIARAAGISVGAFYERYPNKDAFLSMVISYRLHGAREHMERVLEPERWRCSAADAVTRAIVLEMMRGLHGPSACVIRATLKRGHRDRKNLEPLLRYRKSLADSSVALLAHRAKNATNSARSVRSAVQMAEATVLDALLHDAGALRPGSQRMAASLSAMMLRMLGLSGSEHAVSQDERDETPERADDDGEVAMLDMPIEEVIAITIPEPAVPPRSRRRRVARDPEAEPIRAVSPRHIGPEKEETREPPVRLRRRRRPRL